MRREYELYDRNVDIVSAFQWFFLGTKEMPAVVRHFDRYPRLPSYEGGETRELTPDFTVLFNDGTAWVAEIANIARHETSIEKLCLQLDAYSRLNLVKDRNGQAVKVSAVDVVLLSPVNTAADAVRRIYTERLDNPTHKFKPASRPYFMQFAQQPNEYVFQPWPDRSINGVLHGHGSSDLTSMKFPNLNIKPEFFADNKVQYAFCNDSIPPLYLAVRLLMNVFPSLQPDWGESKDVTAGEIAAALQHQYGHGLVADVVKAMDLLSSAGFAAARADRSYRIFKAGRLVKASNLPDVIASRALAKAAEPRPVRRQRTQTTALFDSISDLEALPNPGSNAKS